MFVNKELYEGINNLKSLSKLKTQLFSRLFLIIPLLEALIYHQITIPQYYAGFKSITYLEQPEYFFILLSLFISINIYSIFSLIQKIK